MIVDTKYSCNYCELHLYIVIYDDRKQLSASLLWYKDNFKIEIKLLIVKFILHGLCLFFSIFFFTNVSWEY